MHSKCFWVRHGLCHLHQRVYVDGLCPWVVATHRKHRGERLLLLLLLLLSVQLRLLTLCKDVRKHVL